jgi:D-alanine-D-alanine ligase
MKRTVAVIFGGRSAEHEVSIVTAHIPVMQALQATGDYDIVPVYISEEGDWYSDQAFIDLAYFQQPSWRTATKKLKKLDISVNGGLTLIWPGLRAKRKEIDVVFPAMHGTYGEDGSLTGLLRMSGVPFVGCDMAASAVAMDKVLTKQVAEAAGIPGVNYAWFSKAEFAANRQACLARLKDLKYPLFVKPPHLGSSIAITKVDKPKDLENAIEVALHYDDKCLVEEGVHNLIEVTVPIMLSESEHWLAKVERPNAEFFDFDTKYIGAGGKKGSKTGGVNSGYSELPAKLEPDLYRACEDITVKTARALGLYGISRVDLLIDSKTNTVYMNEVNTLPGSLYAHNWRAAGYTTVELVQKLIALADQRAAAQQDVHMLFTSDILKVVGSGQKAGL